MSTIIYIILAFIVLLLMVTIHEFGHYIAGKILKFKINEFSVGFGPAIFSKKKKNGEIFSLRAIPLGGYCAFEGEEGNSDDSGAFSKQAPWKRMIVLVSGALFNIISGFLFSLLLLCTVGYDLVKVVDTNIAAATNPQVIEANSKIYSLAENDGPVMSFIKDEDNRKYFDDKGFLKGEYSVQYIYEYCPKIETSNYIYNLEIIVKDYVSGEQLQKGHYVSQDNKYILKSVDLKVLRVYNDIVQKGDIIERVNGHKVGFNKQVSTLINKYAEDNRVSLTVERNGEEITLENVPVVSYKVKKTSGDVENKTVGITIALQPYSFGKALLRCIPFTLEICWAVLVILFQLITGQLALSAIGGPVTTIATIAGYSSQSLKTLLVLLPLIAANLGVFNLLPFPALDGAHVVFTGIEWLRGKPINPELENNIHTIGLLVLFGLVIVADVYQVFFARILKTLF